MGADPLAAWRPVLKQRHVSAAIVERIERLNPSPQFGVRLRGIHYKDDGGYEVLTNSIRKGAFIRRFGREAYNALDRRHIIKRGRREYIVRLTFS